LNTAQGMLQWSPWRQRGTQRLLSAANFLQKRRTFGIGLRVQVGGHSIPTTNHIPVITPIPIPLTLSPALSYRLNNFTFYITKSKNGVSLLSWRISFVLKRTNSFMTVWCNCGWHLHRFSIKEGTQSERRGEQNKWWKQSNHLIILNRQMMQILWYAVAVTRCVHRSNFEFRINIMCIAYNTVGMSRQKHPVDVKVCTICANTQWYKKNNRLHPLLNGH
jgi:hypothetical protein